jgi:3-hydroxyacyl-CoA dehydrogenase
MESIAKAVVIGAGTMGSGIAGHLANAGVPVVLLDVVPEGAEDRNVVARSAVGRLLDSSPPALMHPGKAELITIGNIEDDMAAIAEADWIAEAVVERLDVKQALYREIERHRKPGAMVSSNTSTIPLALLTEGMPVGLVRDFCITHFFNPVRYMRLLELVAGPQTRPEVTARLGEFCDLRLGKGVIPCRDTPGFLANRVGCYALQVAMVEALNHGLTIEEADAIVGRPMGIPKTGVFGLYDLIGLDLMLDVSKSLTAALPASDDFVTVAEGIPVMHDLVRAGHRGQKSGAGFYRIVGSKDDPLREAVDLQTGHYRPAERPHLEAAIAGETQGLRALVESPDKYGRYAWHFLARTLSYAASLVPEVSDDPLAIDEAMKLGYSWTQGPFEMIDTLGVGWFVERLESEGMAVPSILQRARAGSLYRAEAGCLERTPRPMPWCRPPCRCCTRLSAWSGGTSPPWCCTARRLISPRASTWSSWRRRPRRATGLGWSECCSSSRRPARPCAMRPSRWSRRPVGSRSAAATRSCSIAMPWRPMPTLPWAWWRAWWALFPRAAVARRCCTAGAMARTGRR